MPSAPNRPASASDALAEIPLPVAIVAAAAGLDRSCSTGTLTYVSYSPPLVATSLAHASRTYRLLHASRAFSVSLLAEAQAELAVRAALPSTGDKFDEQELPVLGPTAGGGPPGIAGAAAVLWCDLESETELAEHVLCVGRVVAWAPGPAEPLVRAGRRYRGLGADVPVAGETGYPL